MHEDGAPLRDRSLVGMSLNGAILSWEEPKRAKFRLAIVTRLTAFGLNGILTQQEAAYPLAQVPLCIVHMNSKYLNGLVTFRER